MKYTIDRFEGKYAVVELEDGSFADIPRNALPREAREGDILTVKVDREGTKKRRSEVRKMENELFVD